MQQVAKIFRKKLRRCKVITGIRRCGKSYLLNNLFYHHLLESGVDADHIIRFAFDSAEDLYFIGESLIQIEKEKRGADPEKQAFTPGRGEKSPAAGRFAEVRCFSPRAAACSRGRGGGKSPAKTSFVESGCFCGGYLL